jgi:hypothetical protein
MNLTYAGIGSRQTPHEILEIMRTLGQFLAIKNCTLRSGGADGADMAFEEGCDLGNGKKEIYLPWKKFNDNLSSLYYTSEEITEDTRLKSFDLAEEFHPGWIYLSLAAKFLIARNGFQVLGKDLFSPVDMVLYWCPSDDTGGTGQALRIATAKDIPTFNIGYKTERLQLAGWLGMDLGFLETNQTYNLVTSKWE